MKKTIFHAILFLVAVFQPAFAQAASHLVDGESLYNRYCSPCHGEKAVGQDPASPNGGWRDDGSLIAPALDGTAHSWHHGPELLYDYVKSGSVNPESPMPSFGDRLDDDQIKAIIVYFQSLWPEKIRGLYLQRFPGSLE
jgi:mono/diheme cytochrome c family protein